MTRPFNFSAPMRQPHETLRDRTHLSQAHTRLLLLPETTKPPDRRTGAFWRMVIPGSAPTGIDRARSAVVDIDLPPATREFMNVTPVATPKEKSSRPRKKRAASLPWLRRQSRFPPEIRPAKYRFPSRFRDSIFASMNLNPAVGATHNRLGL